MYKCSAQCERGEQQFLLVAFEIDFKTDQNTWCFQKRAVCVLYPYKLTERSKRKANEENLKAISSF